MRLTCLALLCFPLIIHADEPAKAGPDWWSLQPLRNSPAPHSRPHPVDAFLFDALRAKNLDLAPEADRRTLIRRLTFDLTGLPPTPAEVDAFLGDDRPDAYEHLVDRLLASPRYGERFARHWLDVVRFGESDGFERDKLRDHAWRYRDYVISALNRDLPYGQFMSEQMAGDVHEHSDPNSVVATGMLVAGPFDEVAAVAASPSVRAQARQDELEDMLAVVGQSFLGLTINCARCHDHKFDPITQRDYYRMQAVFAGVKPGTREILSPTEKAERAATLRRLQQRLADIQARIAKLEQIGRERVRPEGEVAGPQPVARWNFDRDGRDQIGTAHAELHGQAKIENGRLVLGPQGGFARTAPLPFALHTKSLEAWVTVANLEQRGGGVMSVESPNGNVFDAIVFGERQSRRWMSGSNNFVRTRDVDGPAEDRPTTERIHIIITYSADQRITIYRNGEPYGASYTVSADNGVPAFAKEQSRILFGLRHTGGGNAQFYGSIDEARLYDRALSATEVQQALRSTGWYIAAADARNALTATERTQLSDLERERATIERTMREQPTTELAYSGVRVTPEPVHLLRRGDITKKGEVVSAAGLPVVPGPAYEWELPVDAPEGVRRLAFASWLSDPRNPLPWRTIVNRVWQWHFGRGIVGTPSDFGFNGDRPTHPELLDWLAQDFLAHGQSLKHLHRRILTSAAYRQSSRFNPMAAEKDSENTLLWRYPPRRLEGETIRDAMLFVSGNLNERMGGPSYRPFRLTVFNSNFYDLLDDGGPDTARRTVYRMNVQSARDPLLEALDCPDPSTRTPRRAQTTTPIQALGLMNGVFVQRMSQSLAERCQSAVGAESAKQVDYLFEMLFSRSPRAEERSACIGLIQEHGTRALCWVLLNSSEFSYLR